MLALVDWSDEPTGGIEDLCLFWPRCDGAVSGCWYASMDAEALACGRPVIASPGGASKLFL
jgi:hypothetical protein